MRHKFSLRASLVLGLMLLVQSAVQAQDPEPFARTGVIGAIDWSEQRIVIYDVNYRFPESAPVYIFKPQDHQNPPEEPKRVSQQQLRVGMQVGYTVAEPADPTWHRIVTAVWILPQETGRPKGKQEPGRTTGKR
jgi:hypothetical protein